MDKAAVTINIRIFTQIIHESVCGNELNAAKNLK